MIDYLRTENQVLWEKLGKRRILLNDDQRRRLAVKGRFLGRKLLQEIGTIFTPDTILRWHRQLVAKKWDYTLRREKKPGRPRVRQVIVNLALRFAKENPSWGYDRIQGVLANVGYPISDTTVENILKAHGVEPTLRIASARAPGAPFSKPTGTSWPPIDFTTVEVWTKGGMLKYYYRKAA